MTTESQPSTAFRTIDDLIAFLVQQATAAGENPGFTALDHGLQCAYELTIAAPDDVELQLAGLVHDIGHHLVIGDDAGHGRHGGDAVRHLLGHRVAALVELHVPAKRYLVSVDPAYRAKLSPISVATLHRQGGDMTVDEAASFASHPLRASALELRNADEAAKVPNRKVPGLAHWIPLLAHMSADVDGSLAAGGAAGGAEQ
ncbi:MAG: metal-dependent phosphohydrolase [Acidimicrobiia bacterium]